MRLGDREPGEELGMQRFMDFAAEVKFTRDSDAAGTSVQWDPGSGLTGGFHLGHDGYGSIEVGM